MGDRKLTHLHLGCGDVALPPPWTNIDVRETEATDIVTDIRHLFGVADESVGIIYCVPGDEKVDTPEGGRPISGIRPGDTVCGATGPVRVVAVTKRKYSGGGVVLEMPHGAAVVTKHHPIATPRGWLQADQLRHTDQVFSPAAVIEPAEFVDGVDVFRHVACRTPARSRTSCRVRICSATSNKLQHDLCLSSLAHEIWRDASQQRTRRLHASVHRQPMRRLAGSGSAALLVNAVRNSRFHEHAGYRPDHVLVSVDDLGLRRYGRWPNAKADTPFAVNEASHIRPLGVVHPSSVHGMRLACNVYNLETDDGTFFVNGVLTHNCSHVLDHFGRFQYMDVLRRWYAVLKPGGILRLSVVNFAEVVDVYRQTWDLKPLIGLLVARQDYPSNVRHMHWDYSSLSRDLSEVGFTTVRPWNWRLTDHAHIDDCSQAYMPPDKESGRHMSLNIEGVK